jgi:hypothetical protein
MSLGNLGGDPLARRAFKEVPTCVEHRGFREVLQCDPPPLAWALGVVWKVLRLLGGTPRGRSAPHLSSISSVRTPLAVTLPRSDPDPIEGVSVFRRPQFCRTSSDRKEAELGGMLRLRIIGARLSALRIIPES